MSVNMSSNRREIVKESQVELSVPEGGREGGREFPKAQPAILSLCAATPSQKVKKNIYSK